MTEMKIMEQNEIGVQNGEKLLKFWSMLSLVKMGTFKNKEYPQPRGRHYEEPNRSHTVGEEFRNSLTMLNPRRQLMWQLITA